MNKKAQIKFGETFGIIILVYIMFVSGMVWYNSVNSNSILEMQERDKIDRAFEKYYYVVNLDLLHVSEQGNVDQEFDLVSLRNFYNYSKTNDAREIVRRQLGDSLVRIQILDKVGDKFKIVENITLYNNSLDESDVKLKENFKTVVSVSDPITNDISLAYLEVIVY